MTVARTTEITSTSSSSFQDALEQGLKRTSETLENVSGAWIKDQEVVLSNGSITQYKVRMMVTFQLRDG